MRGRIGPVPKIHAAREKRLILSRASQECRADYAGADVRSNNGSSEELRSITPALLTPAGTRLQNPG